MISKQVNTSLEFTCDISKLLISKNCFESGRCVVSKSFNIDNYICFLRFYPNGKILNDNKPSAYIVLNSINNNNILLNDNRLVTTKMIIGNRSTKFIKKAKTYARGWGWSTFLDYKLLTKLNILKICISIENDNNCHNNISEPITPLTPINNNNRVNNIPTTIYPGPGQATPNHYHNVFPPPPPQTPMYPIYIYSNNNSNNNIGQISPLPYIDSGSDSNDDESLVSYSTFPDINDLPANNPEINKYTSSHSNRNSIIQKINIKNNNSESYNFDKFIYENNQQLNTLSNINATDDDDDIYNYDEYTDDNTSSTSYFDDNNFENDSVKSKIHYKSNTKVSTQSKCNPQYCSKKSIDFSNPTNTEPIIFSDSDDELKIDNNSINSTNNDINNINNNNDNNNIDYNAEGGNVIELELDNTNVTNKQIYNFFPKKLKPIKIDIHLKQKIAEITFETTKQTEKAYKLLVLHNKNHDSIYYIM